MLTYCCLKAPRNTALKSLSLSNTKRLQSFFFTGRKAWHSCCRRGAFEECDMLCFQGSVYFWERLSHANSLVGKQHEDRQVKHLWRNVRLHTPVPHLHADVGACLDWGPHWDNSYLSMGVRLYKPLLQSSQCEAWTSTFEVTGSSISVTQHAARDNGLPDVSLIYEGDRGALTRALT